MDWSQIRHFKEKEFFGQAELLQDTVIHNIDSAREILCEPIYVSPAPGAIARFGGNITSQHYVGPSPSKITRKSTALDAFIEGIPFLNFSALVYSNLFSGIGIYLDTRGPDGKPWVMFHLDLRNTYRTDKPLVWICLKGLHPTSGDLINKYFYPQNNNEYWQLLNRKIFYTEKELE